MSSKDKSSCTKKCKGVEPISILSLPHELLVYCLACVSRLYHPTLSLVCKTFRSIISSPELYETRSVLKRTESCLYLCLHYSEDPNTYWYTLCKNPNQNVTSKSSNNLFTPVSSPLFLKGNVNNKSSDKSLVAVGSDIYQINDDGSSSSSVYVMDCRTHKWDYAPRMRMARSFFEGSVIDGKIYVSQRFTQYAFFVEWVEVFDLETQTWGLVTDPQVQISNGGYRHVTRSGLEGKFYQFCDDPEGVVYNPSEDTWSPIRVNVRMGYVADRSDSTSYYSTSYCLIDNVLFYCDEGVFKWYDVKERSWKELKGLEGLPDQLGLRGLVKIVDLGGKMAVLWFDYNFFRGRVFPRRQKPEIWYAEIALERRDDKEIWGKIEWFDNALTISGFESRIGFSDNVCSMPHSRALSRIDVLSATV